MKALPKILLALTTVAALAVAYPAKANLITNGGFETGDLTGWVVLAVTPFVVGTFAGVSPHSGNFQVTDPIGHAEFGQTLPTTPGQSYTVDFWVADNVGGLVQVSWGGSIVFGHIFPAQTDYTEFSFNVTASSDSTSLGFSLSQVTMFLDDISVEKSVGVGVPDGGSTVSLLGFALLGLAALRRKLRC